MATGFRWWEGHGLAHRGLGEDVLPHPDGHEDVLKREAGPSEFECGERGVTGRLTTSSLKRTKLCSSFEDHMGHLSAG